MGIVLLSFLMGNGLNLPWKQARGKRAEIIPTRRSSRIKSYENNDSDYAKLKVSTHLASAISRDNPFVMLALDKIQEAIVDDKNPPKHVLDNI